MENIGQYREENQLKFLLFYFDEEYIFLILGGNKVWKHME